MADEKDPKSDLELQAQSQPYPYVRDEHSWWAQTRSKSERDVNIKARDYLKEIIDLSKTEVMYVEDFNMFNRTHRKDFGKAVDGVLYVNMQDMKENAQVMRMYDFLCNYYVTYKDTEGVFPIMPNWNTNERVEVVHMVAENHSRF